MKSTLLFVLLLAVSSAAQGQTARAARRPRATAAEARAALAGKEAAEIEADQKRLRDNIEALTKTAEARQLISRYVQKADQQETRLEQLARNKQAAVEERRQLQAQLDDAISALALDRKL
jgi:hypothetical protein